MNKKIAIIFGVTGQDGSYLSRLLIKKIIELLSKRKSSSFNTERINDLYKQYENKNEFKLIYGDLTDSLSVNSIIEKINLTKYIILQHNHMSKFL